MPTDEYAPTVRGGLKLKGSKPAGIEKKKKKKKSSSVPSSSEPASTSKDLTTTTTSTKPTSKEEEEEIDEEKLRELEERGGDGKTDSERAYEEMRRKRLQDRIAREGPKTHKQRVEELNKYLSNLSEHHDMPRIGPG